MKYTIHKKNIYYRVGRIVLMKKSKANFQNNIPSHVFLHTSVENIWVNSAILFELVSHKFVVNIGIHTRQFLEF